MEGGEGGTRASPTEIKSYTFGAGDVPATGTFLLPSSSSSSSFGCVGCWHSASTRPIEFDDMAEKEHQPIGSLGGLNSPALSLLTCLRLPFISEMDGPSFSSSSSTPLLPFSHLKSGVFLLMQTYTRAQHTYI